MISATMSTESTRKELIQMLMRTDPFRDLDRLTEAMFGTTGRPAVMPMDAYRQGDTFHIDLDLPGVDPDSIDVTVEQNVLTVHAERRPAINEEAERVVRERTFGTFSRQVFLGETLDVERLSAGYEAGVLTIKLPVAEQAKPRKISVSSTGGQRQIAS
ncbi:MAG: Hsp20/alpha crystallin family protein [Nocardioidaceae bacterium]